MTTYEIPFGLEEYRDENKQLEAEVARLLAENARLAEACRLHSVDHGRLLLAISDAGYHIEYSDTHLSAKGERMPRLAINDAGASL